MRKRLAKVCRRQKFGKHAHKTSGFKNSRPNTEVIEEHIAAHGGLYSWTRTVEEVGSFAETGCPVLYEPPVGTSTATKAAKFPRADLLGICRV